MSIYFEAPKTLLCSAPYFLEKFGKPFLLEVDASGTGVGAGFNH